MMSLQINTIKGEVMMVAQVSQREKMDSVEKRYYAQAKEYGLAYLQIWPSKITFQIENDYCRISRMNPSKEFVKLMRELR